MQMLDPNSTDVVGGTPPLPARNPSVIGAPLRFLLISHPRSGTQMLANALEARPEVALFNLYSNDCQRPAAYHAVYEAWRWQEVPEGITHLGTTMHRVGSGWVGVASPVIPTRFWSMVAEHHDRFVCLHRENPVRQFLSRMVGIAIKTYDVLRPRAEKPAPPPLALPVAELASFADTLQWLRDDIDRHFPARLVLTYEQLCADWRTTLRQVLEYLDLPAGDAPPSTYRQETRPLREAIENYGEVAAWAINRGHPEWMEEV